MRLPPPAHTEENLKLWNYWISTILEEASEKLNEWEDEFIYSIIDRLENNLRLTNKQIEKLEEIYARYTK